MFLITKNRLIFLGFLACLACVWSLYCSMSRGKPRRYVDRSMSYVSPSDPDVSGAHALLNDGCCYRLDRQFHTVSVRSEFWLGLDRESKAGVVRIFSRYFQATTGAGWCKILGDVNDDVWAEWSAWSGVEIHR